MCNYVDASGAGKVRVILVLVGMFLWGGSLYLLYKEPLGAVRGPPISPTFRLFRSRSASAPAPDVSDRGPLLLPTFPIALPLPTSFRPDADANPAPTFRTLVSDPNMPSRPRSLIADHPSAPSRPLAHLAVHSRSHSLLFGSLVE